MDPKTQRPKTPVASVECHEGVTHSRRIAAGLYFLAGHADVFAGEEGLSDDSREGIRWLAAGYEASAYRVWKTGRRTFVPVAQWDNTAAGGR